ncbi:glycosyltransferase family protein [Metabacillus sp. 113a]|uniref:glycosyltransferase family protein n=1 Tax=Metabacillus sp. 113a TaxID=3404706 RepID=UPI003CF59DDE
MIVLFLESHPMWIYGLPNGFKDAGHTAVISGPISSEILTGMIDKVKPDLIVSTGWTEEHWEAKQIWIREAVSKAKIPLVYWATEDPLHTHNFTLPLIRRMKPDFVFTVSSSLCKMYEDLGIKAAHLDFGYHESVHRRTLPLPEYRANIAVVANAYPDYIKENPDVFRSSSLQTLIAPLIQNGIRVDFWGKNWEHMGKYLGRPIPREWIHGYVDYRDAYKIYNSAKIIIGLQNCEDQLTQRTYEILGSGGFLLTSDTPAVKEKFVPGRDLAVSSNPLETVQRVEYFLKNPLKRKLIQNRGFKAVEDNSYHFRALEMLKIIKARGILKETPQSPGEGRWISYETCEIHHVQQHETLWSISKKNNVFIQQLKELNQLSGNKIFPGQILILRNRKAAPFPRTMNVCLRFLYDLSMEWKRMKSAIFA